MAKPPEVFVALLEELGGDPLEGSGFEDEVPERMVFRTDDESGTKSREQSTGKEEDDDEQ